MPYPLNNATTSDQYNDNGATLLPPRPMSEGRITVANAAVYAQLERCDGMRVGAGVMLPEEFWVPGVYGIQRPYRVGRVRFRSAVAGTPAQVSATATALA
jgi:hypothetical protein